MNRIALNEDAVQRSANALPEATLVSHIIAQGRQALSPAAASTRARDLAQGTGRRPDADLAMSGSFAVPRRCA